MTDVPGVAAHGAVRAPSVHNKWLRRLAVVSLIAVGLTLIVLGTVNLFDSSAAGPTTVAKQSTTSVTAPPKAPGATTTATSTAAASKAQGGTTTTTVSSTDTTTPGKTSVRSSATAGALFGLGAIVFLVGLFFGRIQEVTLPGGAGLKLSPRVQEAVKTKVEKKLKQDPNLKDDPNTALTLYDATLRELQDKVILRSLGVPGSGARTLFETPPGDQVLDEVVNRAAHSLTS